MPVNPEIRASDTDREHVVAVLREHAVDGRLTFDEMLERIDVAYAARTLGDLRRLLADLPATPVPTPPSRTGPPGRDAGTHAVTGLRARWVTYCSISLLCLAIWLGTSLASASVLYFWPVWVMGPWGAALLAKTGRRGATRRLPAWKGG